MKHVNFAPENVKKEKKLPFECLSSHKIPEKSNGQVCDPGWMDPKIHHFLKIR